MTALASRRENSVPASQRFIDRLVAHGTKKFAALAAGDLRELKRAIDSSSSFEELRANILKTYKDLPKPQTDALLEIALSLASLAGEASVKD